MHLAARLPLMGKIIWCHTDQKDSQVHLGALPLNFILLLYITPDDLSRQGKNERIYITSPSMMESIMQILTYKTVVYNCSAALVLFLKNL